MEWLLLRRSALGYIVSDKSALDLRELSKQESELLMSAFVHDTSSNFWAEANLVSDLCRWGSQMSMWLRGCSCHDVDDPGYNTCTLRGRRAVELACGQAPPMFSGLEQNLVLCFV